MQIDGCTAMITGASAGIGREFTRQLGGRAATLVLVARRKARLEELRGELLKRHRAGDTEERVKNGIHLSINGLAAGLRNSG